MAAIYSIDTSSLMDWRSRFYPVDTFPGIVARMDQLIASGQLVASELVREEAEAVGTTDLQEWVQSRSSMFVPTSVLLKRAVEIKGLFPGLTDPKADFEEADAYVIALAERHEGLVVSAETPAAQKGRRKRSHYIPDVCRELGVPCINLLGMMRREGWKF